MRHSFLNFIILILIVSASFAYPISQGFDPNTQVGAIVSASSFVNQADEEAIAQNEIKAPLLKLPAINKKIPSFESAPSNQYVPAHQLPASDNNPSPKRRDNFSDFNLLARSGVVIDLDTKDVLFGKNEDQVRSLASITKLMSALVFFDQDPNYENIYQMKSTDRRDGGKINIYTGDRIKILDLFNVALVASDNSAIIALISSVGMTESAFVKKMNEKSKELGLTNTFFKDPTGLSENNVSTARDIAKLARVALANEKVSNALKQQKYSFMLNETVSREVESTNELFEMITGEDFTLLGGKTGYNNLAGYCFVSIFNNTAGNQVVSVVLGAAGKEDRFTETKKMVEWVYKNYQW